MKGWGKRFIRFFMRSLAALVLPVILFWVAVTLYEQLRAPYDVDAVGFALTSDGIIFFDRSISFPLKTILTVYGKGIVEPVIRPVKAIFEGILALFRI